MISHQRQTGCVLTSIQQGMLKCAIATIQTHTRTHTKNNNKQIDLECGKMPYQPCK